MSNVGAALKLQHRDRFIFRVDDPILRDARFRIVSKLYHRIALYIVEADDLYYQISAESEGILIAWVIDIEAQY